MLPHRSPLGHDPLNGRANRREDSVPKPVLELDALHVEEEDGKDVEEEGDVDLLSAGCQSECHDVDGLFGRVEARKIDDRLGLLLQVKVQWFRK